MIPRSPGGRGALAALLLGPLAAATMPAQSLHTVSSVRAHRGERQLDVSAEFAAGRFRIWRDAAGTLYRSRITYNEERFHPVMEYTPGELTLGLKTNRGRSQLNTKGADVDHQTMDLSVGPGVPTSFDLSFGAAEADLDFGGLDLTRATIKTGASQSRIHFSTPTSGRCDRLTVQLGAAEFRAEQLGNSGCRTLDFAGGVGDVTLDFGGQWSDAEVRADVALGMGSLKLRLPRGIGVEIEMTRFLSSFDQSGLVKRGSRYYTQNWDTAKAKLNLNIKAVLGSVEVEWQ